MDLMRDKSRAIRTQAARTSQALSDLGGRSTQVHAESIRTLKFETHNQAWLAETRKMEGSEEDGVVNGGVGMSGYSSDMSPSSFRFAVGLDERAADLNWLKFEGSPR